MAKTIALLALCKNSSQEFCRSGLRGNRSRQDGQNVTLALGLRCAGLKLELTWSWARLSWGWAQSRAGLELGLELSCACITPPTLTNSLLTEHCAGAEL